MSRVSEVLNIVRRASLLGDYDSNVIGMAAEIIAEDEYGLIKTNRGTKAIDGFWFKEGIKRSVQVKAFSDRRIRNWKKGTFFRIPALDATDDLLAFLIYSNTETYEILYNGPTGAFTRLAGNSKVVRLDMMVKEPELSEILNRCKEI